MTLAKIYSTSEEIFDTSKETFVTLGEILSPRRKSGPGFRKGAGSVYVEKRIIFFGVRFYQVSRFLWEGGENG